jgi:hypothetical protein
VSDGRQQQEAAEEMDKACRTAHGEMVVSSCTQRCHQSVSYS